MILSYLSAIAHRNAMMGNVYRTLRARALPATSKLPKRHVQHDTLAIRREDVSVWERRAPLTPSHVRKLVREGVRVVVQPSNRRAFTVQEYINAGAIVKEDISDCPVILSVKRPIGTDYQTLLPNKTYVFFSHTIKAQKANMPMLDVILERNIRLIDYERMLDSRGNRVVAFGQYAGIAGMVNILHGLGLRLLALGHHTPFMYIGPAHNYRSVGMAKQAIRDAGYEISLGYMPKSIGPITFVFTGSGNVSQGAQEVFYELPYEMVKPQHLAEVSRHGSPNKVYGTIVSRDDYLVRREGGQFDAEEYTKHPERYASNFSTRFAPYASVIVNGIFWSVHSPRLLTLPDAKTLLRPVDQPWLPQTVGAPALPHKLLAICDISADPGGSIEFMRECTTIDKPFALYDAEQNMNYESFNGAGVLICSIDNMPTQLPREAAEFFGNLLLPYIPDLLKSDATKPFNDYAASPVVKNAVISSNGHLTPNFTYIADLRRKLEQRDTQLQHAQSSSRRVLVLGAGYVAGPVIDYLTRDGKLQVTVVSDSKSQAESLATRYPNTVPAVLNVQNDAGQLEKLTEAHNMVVSLLPYRYHPEVLRMCIRHKRHMVTASYVSPEMQALAEAAEQAGITCMNEIGLDPGIDHMYAMQVIDDARSKGAKVTSFESYCGGLPAPENSDNPIRYKFSWSPEGVLLACLNGARYLKDGRLTEIRPGDLLMHDSVIDFLPGFNLEGFPNRDSMKYADLYGIRDTVKTMLRGTLRYRGFANAMLGFMQLGLLDTKPHPALHAAGPEITWNQLLSQLLGKSADVFTGTLKDAVLAHFGNDHAKFDAINGLGFFDDVRIEKNGTPLHTASAYLNKRCAYAPGERDIVILFHRIGEQYPDGTRVSKDVRLVVYGDAHADGYSAMAKTVGFPCGVAARMILDEEIQQRGLLLPLATEIYRPILKRLGQEGIKPTECETEIPMSHH